MLHISRRDISMLGCPDSCIAHEGSRLSEKNGILWNYTDSTALNSDSWKLRDILSMRSLSTRVWACLTHHTGLEHTRVSKNEYRRSAYNPEYRTERSREP